MKINILFVVPLLFVLNCSIFTLDHSNPNDPLNEDVQGEILFPNFEKLYANIAVSDVLSSSGSFSRTYYYKFGNLDSPRIEIDNKSYNYDYYYNIEVYDQEGTLKEASYNEKFDETIYIDKSDFDGDYMVINIDRGNFSYFSYDIEIYGY